MARIGAIQDDSLDKESNFCGISYITDEVSGTLYGLPEISCVKERNKKLMGILKDFAFYH